MERREFLTTSVAGAGAIVAMPVLGSIEPQAERKPALQEAPRLTRDGVAAIIHQNHLNEGCSNGRVASRVIKQMACWDFLSVQPSVRKPEGSLYFLENYWRRNGKRVEISELSFDSFGTFQDVELNLHIRSEFVKLNPRNWHVSPSVCNLTKSVDLFACSQIDKNIGTRIESPRENLTSDRPKEAAEFVYVALCDMGSVIHRKTFRGGSNHVIASPEICRILLDWPGSLPAIWTDKTEERSFKRLTYVGTLSKRWRIFCNPFAEPWSATCVYKGDSFMDAGLCWNPYLVADQNGIGRDAWTVTDKNKFGKIVWT